MLHGQLMVNPAELNKLTTTTNNLAPALVQGAAARANAQDRAKFLKEMADKGTDVAALLSALSKG